MTPKTVKSFLKLALDIAYTNRDDLLGSEKLTGEEYTALGNIRASVQNELGEFPGLLRKFKMEYKSINEIG